MQQSARAELAEQRLAEILGMDPTIATVAQAFCQSHSYVAFMTALLASTPCVLPWLIAEPHDVWPSDACRALTVTCV